MIKITETEVVGWKPAIRGARNPLNSWSRSDSRFYDDGTCELGENDRTLLTKLCKSGSDHRKFMRMIAVYCDVECSLRWWKEFDTYKVGTVANSCSTMHTIHKAKMSFDNYSCDNMFGGTRAVLKNLIDHMNWLIERYNETGEKQYWESLIDIMPNGFLQKRTVMLNYEVLRNMYHSRKNHKQQDWHTFCDWIKTLPYSELITDEGED